jgi:peptidoglycan hydrolase CwlO-like protein
MSRAEFYRTITNAKPDRLNELLMRNVVPEIINDLNDLRKVNDSLIPELADDVWKSQNKIANIDFDIVDVKKTVANITDTIDALRGVVSMINIDVKMLSDEVKLLDSRINDNHKNISFNIESIKKLQNRKMVFSLDSGLNTEEGN